MQGGTRFTIDLNSSGTFFGSVVGGAHNVFADFFLILRRDLTGADYRIGVLEDVALTSFSGRNSVGLGDIRLEYDVPDDFPDGSYEARLIASYSEFPLFQGNLISQENGFTRSVITNGPNTFFMFFDVDYTGNLCSNTPYTINLDPVVYNKRSAKTSINVTGGSGQYDYSWGISGSGASYLASGKGLTLVCGTVRICPTVTDIVTGCVINVSFG
jgi:hypothetical protein